MSRVEFCQKQIREHIAPPSLGNVSIRIARAAQVLGWSYTRARDVWYADLRIRINPDEMQKIEQLTGVKYERNEVSEARRAIRKADALLANEDQNFDRALAAAMRTFMGVLAGSRAAR